MEGPQIGLLQGEPLGRETTLQEPLATNASLGPESGSHGGRIEPWNRTRRLLADLPQNLENSFLNCRRCLVSVHPINEKLDAMFPVLLSPGVRAARDMFMVFKRTTQRAARVLSIPNLEELAHPAHAG